MKPVFGELTHAGVDDRIAGPALFPRVEQPAILIHLDLVEGLVPVPPCAVGPLVEHRGVEVTEGELPQIGLCAGAVAEVGRHGARVDSAELQVRRHPAGGVEVGAVSVVGVIVETVLHERFPLPPGRCFPGGWLQLDAGVGDVDSAGDVGGIDPPRRLRAGLGGRPPAVAAPGAEEWGEDLVGRAVVLGDPARRHEICRSRLLERNVTQRIADRVVASPTERREVRGHVHRRRADRLGQHGNSLLGTAARHHQAPVEAVAQIAQRVVEVLQPTLP